VGDGPSDTPSGAYVSSSCSSGSGLVAALRFPVIRCLGGLIGPILVDHVYGQCSSSPCCAVRVIHPHRQVNVTVQC
jgi:hypothetical protein